MECGLRFFIPRVFCNFVPLMFLQGPYFSEEGALGLPKAKSWWEHCMQECDVMWKLSMILKYILLFALGNICGYDSNVRYVFTCLNLKMNECLSKLYSWSNKRCEFQQNLRKMYWYHYYKSMFTAVLIFVFKYNVEAKISFAGCTAFIEVLKIKLIIIFY